MDPLQERVSSEANLCLCWKALHRGSRVCQGWRVGKGAKSDLPVNTTSSDSLPPPEHKRNPTTSHNLGLWSQERLTRPLLISILWQDLTSGENVKGSAATAPHPASVPLVIVRTALTKVYFPTEKGKEKSRAWETA